MNLVKYLHNLQSKNLLTLVVRQCVVKIILLSPKIQTYFLALLFFLIARMTRMYSNVSKL